MEQYIFFLFVVTTSFISCVIWIAIYLLGIREALASLPINWILTELLNTGISAFFYIIAFICQLIASISYNNHHGTYIAAAVFGALNTLVYCGATFLLRIEWKSGNTTN
ncbi:hypothetical protein NQ317_002864 [Molorchus minor]|uniref:MARVEL domain-containing protein n=1 Tax=Molorchus minor TaxID=1323400 RepID=A0ABQ9JW78_9CUCU|nr:hypothetical protein NQ317_002864 [Molorchus minor]